METPSSTRRITRSQTKATFSNSTNLSSKKNEETKQRKCLIDITNDSPIVGLASGNLNETPISTLSKQKKAKLFNKTPGSGEALLRGQVKNLLQKVEEEAAISKFLSFDTGCGGRHGLKSFLNSPAGLLAPTPANTPQLLSFGSAFRGFETLGCVLESPPVVEDHLSVSKVLSVISDDKQEVEKETVYEKDIISRTLFLDFLDKSDSEQGKSPSKDEDDDASTWSLQVNASTRDEDEDEDEQVYDESDDLEVDELCEAIKSISVNEETTFTGKHIRFVYNSDDELVEEEIEGEQLRLKGLPTPKGKHLRFQDDE